MRSYVVRPRNVATLSSSAVVNGVWPLSLPETVGQVRPSGSTSSLSLRPCRPSSALTACAIEVEKVSCVGMSSLLSIFTDSASRASAPVCN